MDRYDPEITTAPGVWLDLDEQERMVLVEDYHRHEGAQLPNSMLHASIHVIVENRLALGETIVTQVLARLREEGLDRHDAIHAVGSVLAEQIRAALAGQTGDIDAGDAYNAELQKLTARKWLAS